MAKEKAFGYELKIYWDDDCTIECRYFHKKKNAKEYALQNGNDYNILPMSKNEACWLKSYAWMD